MNPDPTNPTPHITTETLLALRQKLQETRKLHAALAAEKARNDALISQLRTLLSLQKPNNDPNAGPQTQTSNGTAPTQTFSFLTEQPSAKSLGISFASPNENTDSTSTTSNPTANPLSESTQFLLAQLPHLRRHLATLRPHLATSGSNAAAVEVDLQGDVLAERKAYIESQTRRALERRGVDVNGVAGGSVGGVGSGGDGVIRRPAGAEEVMALEAVVEALGAGGNDDDYDGRDRMED